MTTNYNGHLAMLNVRCHFLLRRYYLEENNAQNHTITIKKTIGKTTYDVLLHFRDVGDETLEDRILRLIAQDARKEVV